MFPAPRPGRNLPLSTASRTASPAASRTATM